MKTLIIGGVAGGASCAARLRRMDEDADIVMLERGDHISYANCGLPYRVGDVIQTREALLLQTPESMRDKYCIDVRVRNEAIQINRDTKTVTIKDWKSGNTYEESYDNLVIATGSSPIRPKIPGIDSNRIRTVWTVNDTDKIRGMIDGLNATSVAVIGGGFIGIEMAENLHERGLRVSLIEAAEQVMTPIDYEMAQLLHENIVQNGVDLHLSDGVQSFEEHGSGVTIHLNSGTTVDVDFVILSIGIRPNTEIAKDAGLTMNARGGIVVDDYLKTSDESIYAVGDAVETEDFTFKDRTMIGLASIANKQGRIVANNIAGQLEKYEGSQGTSVVKVFDLATSFTGTNEKSLIKRGFQKGVDYERIIITQNSHAGYYPGAQPLTLKLLFSMDGKTIYGAQIVGGEGVDKRIDTISTAVRFGGSVDDLAKLELAYAPPFSSAKDPVNMAGFVARNVLDGIIEFADWQAVESEEDAVLLDIREDAELMAFTLPNAIHIPLGELRDRLDELDKSKTIIPFCAIGVRSYNAARTLMNHGFEKVKLYPAGTKFYQSTHYEEYLETEVQEIMRTEPAFTGGNEDTPSITLDCSGMQCPGPIMKVYENVNEMKDGEMLEVAASDPGFARDIAAWCRRTGNELVYNKKEDKKYIAGVRKGIGNATAVNNDGQKDIVVQDTPEGKTIIVFSGDLDKVLASFIIANGAAAMGRPVTMFFTFWGLTVLRKEQKQPVKKTFMESMFGAMLPRGSKKLKLSRMNMGGMGTAMMKKIMNDKNVDSLEALIEKAIANGVKIVACTMSMDVMGIKEEELIDGVELAGVGSYLGDAEESNVNLFI